MEGMFPRLPMKIQQRITKILSPVLAAALCLGPEVASAAPQQSSQPPQSQNSPAAPSNPQSGANADQAQQGNPQGNGTTVDPTKAPLQPVTTYPEAPVPRQDQSQNTAQAAPATTTTEPAPQTQKPPSEPVGAAAAEKVPTAGGAASRPAGAAIAPAKQHQTRSLFLKVGAIAAGGLAAGTIYALSHGTSSKPPGTGAPGATQK
jgi:hypothetical protein